MSGNSKYDNDGLQYNAKKWSGKDLINIGVYTAIYFVIIMVCSFMGLIGFVKFFV